MPDRQNGLFASGPGLVLKASFASWVDSSEGNKSEAPSTVFRLAFGRKTSNDQFFFFTEIGFRWFFVSGAALLWLVFSGKGKGVLNTSWKYLTRSRSVTHERSWSAKEYAESCRKNRKTPFEYRQLDPSKGEIRLLRILPGTDDDDICVNIIHASLRDDPEFAALSYTWGPPTPRYSIALNGYDFLVGANLKDALSQIRRGRGAAQINLCWIDALCINQADKVEVSGHVRVMAQIYEKAATVVVWLGIPSAETELAFAMMRAIEARFHQQSQMQRQHSQSTGFVDSLLTERSQAEWDAIASLFDNPYFRRVWVAQEITNPFKRNVEFIGGRDIQRFSLDGTVRTTYLVASIFTHAKSLDTTGAHPSIRAAYNACRVLDRFTTLKVFRHRLRPRLLSGIRSMLGSRLSSLGLARSRALLWQHEILPLLNSFRSLQATDPRDKVFAVFSILKSYIPDSSIDYHLSTREVYKQVVCDAIEGTVSLEILAYCGGTSRDLLLPSWAPDWRFENSAQLLCASYNAGRRNAYASSVHGPPCVSFDEEEMTVQGTIIDSIKTCSEQPGPFRDECKSDWVKTATTLQLRHQNAEKEREIVDIYRRTLMADCLKSLSWNMFEPTWKDRVKERWYMLIDAVFDPTVTPNEALLGSVETLNTHMDRALSGRRFEYIFQRIPPTNYSSCCESFDALHESDEFRGNAEAMVEVTTGRRLCVTEMQRLGLVPEMAQTGDFIAVLVGALTPFVLRRRMDGVAYESDDNARYEIIGESYIHGLMDGEGFEGLQADGETPRVQSIVLV